MITNLKFTRKDCGTPVDRNAPGAVRAPFPSSQNLIEAKLIMGEREFRTHVPEGTTMIEIIKKAVRENGGSVETKYYPEIGAHEIIRIRIGDTLLEKSNKGIHFYLGESGIPFATRSEKLVFPNADELRISKEPIPIGLQTSADNFDPVKTVHTFFRSFFKHAPEVERLSK
jgi:hypothetical protein